LLRALREEFLGEPADRAASAARLRRLARRELDFRDRVGRNMVAPTMTDWSVIT